MPYRHPKYFFGKYVDENGVEETRMYSMYVRDMDFESGCGIHNDWLIDNGVAKRMIWEDNAMTIVDLPKSYPLIKDDMIKNRGKNTLTFSGGELDWNAKQTLPFEVKGIEI